MSESSLSAGYPEIRREVGRMLGLDRDPSNWTSDQSTDVDDIIRRGLRQFYKPPVLDGERTAHTWSFLHPTTTLTTTASDNTDTLPDDFGGLIGGFTYAADVAYHKIEVVPESQIRHLISFNVSTGFPIKVAIRPRSSDGTDGQRFEALWWPTPDAAYTLSYRYIVNPSMLNASAPYPLGGMNHAETVMASCLAAAESTLDDTHGVRWTEYLMKLRASVAHDRKFGAPDSFGFNLDRSTDLRDTNRFNYTVTVNGVTPS